LLLMASTTLAADGAFSPQRLQQIEREFGRPARERVTAWRQLIADARGLEERQQLERVNRFFNRVEFVDDYVHWGEVDYWATPLETLTSNGGDCEDLSIAKYFALRELGVADERLRLTYVKALHLNQAHMVLAYFPRPDAEPLVLDNLIAEIRPAADRQDLAPVYSFNGDGLWLARERAEGRRVGGAERVGLWRNLLNRMRQRAGQPDPTASGGDSERRQ
jgi:predicted transglutaminase-like cysteine proteinase